MDNCFRTFSPGQGVIFSWYFIQCLWSLFKSQILTFRWQVGHSNFVQFVKKQQGCLKQTKKNELKYVHLLSEEIKVYYSFCKSFCFVLVQTWFSKKRKFTCLERMLKCKTLNFVTYRQSIPSLTWVLVLQLLLHCVGSSVDPRFLVALLPRRWKEKEEEQQRHGGSSWVSSSSARHRSERPTAKIHHSAKYWEHVWRCQPGLSPGQLGSAHPPPHPETLSAPISPPLLALNHLFAPFNLRQTVGIEWWDYSL